MKMMYNFLSIFLVLAPDVEDTPAEDWMLADERAETAYREKSWGLAIEEAQRAISLYEKKAESFHAEIYASLVEQLAAFHSCAGDGRAAVFALSGGIRELLDRYGYGKPELLRLYKDQAHYYNLMFDFSKVNWRLQARVDLAQRFLETGSEEWLVVFLERISWLIEMRLASPRQLTSLLESARKEVGQDSLSSRAWLLEYEARIAEYAGETERAEVISKKLLELLKHIRDGGAIRASIYSRLGLIYLRSGREDAFLDLLADAAGHMNSGILDDAIIHPLPEFSAGAKARGLLAKFTLRVDVDAEGRVIDLSLVESNANDALQQEFLQAVKNGWRFPPGLDADGQRIPRTIASTYFEFAAPNNARRYLR